MKKYLVYLAQVHENFRRAELESLADLFDIRTIDFDLLDNSHPFFIVELPNDEIASQWIRRSILAKAIYEYWGQGSNYQELHENIRAQANYENYRNKHIQDSFKFEFEYYRGNCKSDKVAIIESFSYMGFKGKIDFKDPQQTYTVIERYSPIDPSVAGTVPEQIYFGRLVCTSDREALVTYDLKKRPYKGTTSFEAELSLVSANIAQVKPYTIVHDPFAGTGSFLVAAGHFGGLVIGSDIDGRMIRGRNGGCDINSNFIHYGNSAQLLDLLTMDFTHNALRKNLKIDTILCDPPYGIREGIKTLGARNPEKFAGKEHVIINGRQAHLNKDYIPTKKPYSLDSLLDDLLHYAANRLPLGGRLAFWMPTANDEDIETVVPLHSNLELKYNCVQEFNKWSRRLLLYIQRGDNYNGPTNSGLQRSSQNFRDRYFTGFS